MPNELTPEAWAEQQAQARAASAPKEAPEPAEDAQEAPETEARAKPVREPKEPQEAEEAPAEEASAEGEQEPEGEPEGEEESVELRSLSELAEHLGIDESDVYQLAVAANIGGKRQDVSLSELKDSYVAVAEAKRMQEEAKSAREAARQESERATEEYRAQLAQAGALVSALEKNALARFQGVNWDELRQADPAEWTAKRTELQQAQQEIQQVKQRVQAGIQQFKSQTQERQQQALNEHLAKERAALLSAWPEMADEKKKGAESSALVESLQAYGFSQDEIGEASDHRVLLMARDAMKWRKHQKTADATRKKVVKIAKTTLKPGSRPTKAEQQQDAIRPLRAKLKKSGKVEDFARLLSAQRSN